MAVVEGEKSSTDIAYNGTMSDDEVVASDVPPRYLFFSEINEEIPFKFWKEKQTIISQPSVTKS